MAKNRVKGITIELDLDGTQLNTELKKIDSQLRNTEANLKDVNKLLKLDPKNTELLRQKQQFLNESIKDTEIRLQTLKTAYKNIDGKESQEAKEQQQALAREIAETEQKLKSLKNEAKDFGSVFGQQLKSVGGDLKNVGDKISGVGKDMAVKVTAPIVAGFTIATNKASDYVENLNKMEVAFGDYADSVREFTDSAYADYGLSKVDASANASLFGAMAKGIGLADDKASEMSIELTKLSADLSSYFNTDVEQSATALQAIFTGNAQALKQYGVVMTEVNLKEFAKTLGITEKQFDKLGATDKTMLRYQYVMAQTADAQGDFARTNDDFANASRTLSASLSDLTVAIGQQLLPIINPIITKITEFVHGLSEANPEIFDMVVKIGLVVAAIAPLLVVIGTLISSVGTILQVIGMIANPIGLIVIGITAVITALVTLYKKNDAFRDSVQKMAKYVMSVMNLLWDTLKLIFDSIKTYWDTVWTVITTIVSTKLENIKVFISTILNAISGLISVFGNLIQGNFNGAFEGLKTIANNLLEGLRTIVRNKLDGITSIFSSVWDGAKRIVQNAINAIKGFMNFKWELPKLKLPHFKKTGTTILGLPKIEVEWYAKAMKDGMIMNSPTIFGMNNGKLLGGGESGSEVIVGTNSLMGMIQKAVGTNGMTINMTVNGGNISANELANVVIDKLTNTIQRNNQRW